MYYDTQFTTFDIFATRNETSPYLPKSRTQSLMILFARSNQRSLWYPRSIDQLQYMQSLQFLLLAFIFKPYPLTACPPCTSNVHQRTTDWLPSPWPCTCPHMHGNIWSDRVEQVLPVCHPPPDSVLALLLYFYRTCSQRKQTDSHPAQS